MAEVTVEGVSARGSHAPATLRRGDPCASQVRGPLSGRTPLLRNPAARSSRRGDARAIAAGADRRDRAVAREAIEHLGQVAGADVGRARDVAGLVLGRLADVDDERRLRPTGRERRGEGIDVKARPGLDRAPGTPPGVEAAVDVADDRVEPDAQRLARQVVEVGGVLHEEDDRPVGVDDPAEPRPERRPGRDRQRARDRAPAACASAERASTMSGAATEGRTRARRRTTAGSRAPCRRATADPPG